MKGLFRRRVLPAQAVAYREATRRSLSPKLAFDEVPWLVLDAETTGFRRGHDRILSLSLLPVEGGRLRLAGMRNWLVYQESHSANAATAVHGILPEETRGGVREEALVDELLPLLAGRILVGHHVHFDAGMLDDLLRRNRRVGLCNQIVDTAAMATRHLPAFHQTGYANQRPPTLEEVCAQLDLEMVDRHTAAGDTFTTAEVFLLLAGRLRKRFDRPVRLRDLPLGKL